MTDIAPHLVFCALKVSFKDDGEQLPVRWEGCAKTQRHRKGRACSEKVRDLLGLGAEVGGETGEEAAGRDEAAQGGAGHCVRRGTSC